MNRPNQNHAKRSVESAELPPLINETPKSNTNTMKATMMETTTPARFGTSPQRVGLSAALALFTALAFPAGAATTTLTATGDNTILDGSLAAQNFGNFNPISSGTNGAFTQKSILRFNVSSLDGLYTSIDSITLRVFYADDSSLNTGTAMVTTNVHAITAANRAWTEGNSAGAAAVGESTWNRRVHNTTNWAGSAGLSTAGSDYDSTVLSSSTIDLALANRPTPGTAIDFTFTGDSVALTALIDSWMVDNADLSRDNPGLLLRDPTPTFNTLRNRFTASSTEDANAALHPQLIVNYTAIPEPSSMLLLGFGGLVMFRRRRD
jgi:hypothetical protein